MKRSTIALILAVLAVFALTFTAFADEFNPDSDPSAQTIEQVRAALGAEVPVKAGLNLSAIMKSISNEFWRSLKEGYDLAAKNSGASIRVDATTDEGDEIGQQTMMDNAVNQGVAAVMASPISDSNLAAAVDNAKTEKIPVINVNDGLIANCDYYVGPNAYMNGQLAAEWISKKLGDKGQVGIVIGMAKAFAAATTIPALR